MNAIFECFLHTFSFYPCLDDSNRPFWMRFHCESFKSHKSTFGSGCMLNKSIIIALKLTVYVWKSLAYSKSIMSNNFFWRHPWKHTDIYKNPRFAPIMNQKSWGKQVSFLLTPFSIIINSDRASCEHFAASGIKEPWIKQSPSKPTQL